jgi:hypothetical protein
MQRYIEQAKLQLVEEAKQVKQEIEALKRSSQESLQARQKSDRSVHLPSSQNRK